VASVRTAGSVTVIDVLPLVRVHQSTTVSPQGDVGATKPILDLLTDAEGASQRI
jgi:hypothetical protein